MKTINTRVDNRKTIAEDEKQARLLCDLVQDLFLSKFISESNRGNGILDLMFFSDENLLIWHDY